MSWKEAFLLQAESDYQVFLFFNRSRTPIPICQQLHYLQMSTEKLAKALSCPAGNKPPKTTHAALGRFLRISKGWPELRRSLGYGSDYNAFVSYIDSVLPLAEKIEALAPVGNRLDMPNAEYPWINTENKIIAPVEYRFKDIWEDVAGINKLKTLIANLFRFAK